VADCGVFVDIVSYLVDVAFDKDSWIRVRKNPYSPCLCDSAVGLPLDINIAAAVKSCIKLEDIAPHNFYLVCILISVFAYLFIIAYFIVNLDGE